jgi:hypothetical protein
VFFSYRIKFKMQTWIRENWKVKSRIQILINVVQILNIGEQVDIENAQIKEFVIVPLNNQDSESWLKNFLETAWNAGFGR